jgi:E3 ubiquitin-protein ligase TRIP12
MGRFVAQAILDERLVNLPLSRAFLRALRGEDLVAKDHSEVARSLAFVREIDPAIAQSLTYLITLAEETTADESSERNTSVIESMGLAFTLVGDGTIELCENGKRTDVTLANVREYVRLNVNFLVHDTIQPYVVAFHDGFQMITGCHDARTFLQSFSLSELEFLLADKWLSGDSMWDREGKELRDHMVCDHGYTPHSRAIHDLVAILCELPLDDQRLFVKFVTGANRLPLGGLAKLEPKLTVVRKLAMGGDDSTTGSGADAVLPSASTCTNYLKLPEYSTRETMEKRLAYCIREGQGSFHLS